MLDQFQHLGNNNISNKYISYLGKDVVQSIHSSLIKAIYDLTRLGHNLNIDFGFIKINV